MKSITVLALFFLAVSAYANLNGRFLIIGDIHYDSNYLVNSDPSAFCHSGSGNAGQFGSFGRLCETPGSLIEQFSKFYTSQIKETPIDFAIFIGDSARHDTDSNLPVTQNESLAAVSYIQNMLQNTFINLPVVFTIGNNDVYPDGQLSDQVGNSYLQDLANIYAPFFNTNQKQSFGNYGYYTSDISSSLSLVIMNTLYFYKKNDNTQDCSSGTSSAGYNQFVWLNTTMNAYKQANKKVILIGHVPPVHYFDSCATYYSQMANEYNEMIVTQVFGHEHQDFFEIIDSSSANTLSTSFGGVYNVQPAVYTQYNPTPCRIYSFNPTFPYNLQGYVQYAIDLNEANTNGTVTIFEEYSFPQAYNLSSCTYGSYSTLNTEISNDQTIQNQYNLYMYNSVNVTFEVNWIQNQPNIDSSYASKIVTKIFPNYSPEDGGTFSNPNEQRNWDYEDSYYNFTQSTTKVSEF